MTTLTTNLNHHDPQRTARKSRNPHRGTAHASAWSCTRFHGSPVARTGASYKLNSVTTRRPSPKRRKTAGDAQDVSRIEFENIEAVVRGNRERLVRLEVRLESLAREIAELARMIRALGSKS